MNRLAAIKQEQLNFWTIQAKQKAKIGQLPNYISLLQQVDPDELAVGIISWKDQILLAGKTERTFPLMSVIKPFLLLYLLDRLGTQTVFQRVGKEPSQYPFNSLIQLLSDRGFPRNPMINSGAIALASILPGKDAYSRCENLRLWLNKCAYSQLFLSRPMLDSVCSLPNFQNQALAEEMAANGYLENATLALDTYNRICCLSGTIIELARLGLLLLDSSFSCQITRKIMATCGLYEASEQFFKRVGFPTKSGVSGAVLSIVPSQGAIAIYSPPLNEQGNSVAGLFLVEKIARSIQF
ncbi:MAG: glutaminase [Hydrococcus sp. Prado102]|jgi:glutaminase|nr:glutaminase [Hydrococcus sp. Prado102]